MLFLTIILFITLGGYIVARIFEGTDNISKKSKSAKEGKEYYYDHFSRKRNVKTNKLLYYSNQNGETYLVDEDNNIINNLSRDKRIEELNESLSDIDRQNDTLFYYGVIRVPDKRNNTNPEKTFYYDKIMKELYIEIKCSVADFSKEIRSHIAKVDKNIKTINVYMKPDGTFVRIGDFDRKYYREYPNFEKEIVGRMNELQQKHIKRYGCIFLNPLTQLYTIIEEENNYARR